MPIVKNSHCFDFCLKVAHRFFNSYKMEETSKQGIQEIFDLLEQSSVESLLESLRRLLLHFLKTETEFPMDFKELVVDVEILFDLLQILKRRAV